MLKKLNREAEEFPLPKGCDVAIKVGREWHTCSQPRGHKTNHSCKHYEWDNDEEMWDSPTDKAQRVRIEQA